MKVLEWNVCFLLLVCAFRFRLFVNKCGYCLFIWAVVDLFILCVFPSFKPVSIISEVEINTIENHREKSNGIKVMKAFKHILQPRMFAVASLFDLLCRCFSCIGPLNVRWLSPPLRSKMKHKQ